MRVVRSELSTQRNDFDKEKLSAANEERGLTSRQTMKVGVGKLELVASYRCYFGATSAGACILGGASAHITYTGDVQGP